MARTLQLPIFAVLATLIVLHGAGAPAQTLAPLRLETASDDDRKLLRQIDQMAADDQYAEAVDRLRRLAEEHGDALIGVGRRNEERSGFQRYLPLRTLCDLRLASWATTRPEALALYRQRVDPLAQRWYVEATASRDEGRLRRLVEQMGMSSYGDDALFRLGDLLLERGDHQAARACWERLSPTLRCAAAVEAYPPGIAGGPLWLAVRHLDGAIESKAMAERIAAAPVSVSAAAYPDTDIPLPDIRARLVLASILEGAFDRAETELRLFQELHGEAEGTIAGRAGPLAQLLAELLEQSRSWPHAARHEGWPTFAGNQQRDGAAPRSVDVSGVPTWRAKLPALTRRIVASNAATARTETETVPMLGYFPIVVGDGVYLNNASGIWGWTLDDGLSLELGKNALYSAQRDPLLRVSKTEPPMAYTMNSDGRRLVARMGPPPERDPAERVNRRERSFLVAFDLRSRKFLYKSVPDDEEGEFEGAPVLDDRNLYVLMRKSEPGASVNLYVACYDLRDGSPRWRRWLCGTSNGDLLAEIPPAMLTMAGDSLLVNTNMGCVAAVSTEDGRPQWVLEYPRATATAGESPGRGRCPNPCLVHQGKVLAAPADADGVLALDAATGEVIWRTRLPANAAPQLLGVGGDQLLVGGQSLAWLDFHDGRLRAQFPHPGIQEPTVANARPQGYGRGVLAGGLVYWPTSSSIYIFQQRLAATNSGPRIVAVGEVDLAVRNLSGGNLLVADDVLLLTTNDGLYAFADPGR
ncbi:MAG: PQQ-binding-like beta-propeller repeat protein [Pirellulaceae bacterium]